MFFKHFIEACKLGNLSLNDYLIGTLKNTGIKASLSDLDIDNTGIYFILPNKQKIKVMLYQSKVQESFFRSHGDPLIHICGCKESIANINNADFTATIKTDLKFFVGIYSNRTQIKFYNDKPLSICPACKALLGSSYNGNISDFIRE